MKNLRASGYSRADCETYILLGLPNQSLDSVKETINFVGDAGGKAKLAEFSPIPGTKSFAEAVKNFPSGRRTAAAKQLRLLIVDFR